jgi:hypothetical protein
MIVVVHLQQVTCHKCLNFDDSIFQRLFAAFNSTNWIFSPCVRETNVVLLNICK